MSMMADHQAKLVSLHAEAGQSHTPVADPMMSTPGPTNVEGGFGDQTEPVPSGMAADAGNDDIQENTVDAAVSMAHARLAELESDTHTTTIGDPMMAPGNATNSMTT